MTIETRFAPDDEAWLIHKDKVVSTTVNRVRLTVEPDGMYRVVAIKEYVDVTLDQVDLAFHASALFKTKEDLLKSL